MKPQDITAKAKNATSKKLWWQCEKGHEWEATLSSRLRGTGCPYCANKKVLVGFNDIATTHPEVADQWHPTKNRDLLPTQVIAGSKKKVWWQCEKGHEWQAAVGKRLLGDTGCPYCSNTKVLAGYNDMATTHPELTKQWHPTKNNGLLPTQIIAGSGKKFWWQCEKGHEWSMKAVYRVKGDGCPYCSSKKKLVGLNDMATTHPELAKQWHPTKNNELSPTQIMARGNKTFWWQCEEGHEWEARLSSRLHGSGCPYCANKKVLVGFNDMATTHPELAKQWHPFKNGDLLPDQIMAGSNKKFWWQCEKGHEWQAVPSTRASQGTGCPYCVNKKVLAGFNDMATTHPELAKQWHPAKNGELLPTQVTIGSGKKVWWQCKEGHEWNAILRDRAKGRDCPYCSNRKVSAGYNDMVTTHPGLAKQWHPTKNGDLSPNQIAIYSGKKAWWRCSCGYEFEKKVNQRARYSRCPQCKDDPLVNNEEATW